MEQAIELWWDHVNGFAKDKQIVEALIKERPTILSAVMERTCNLQCVHCIFGEEKSSQTTSLEVGLTDTLRAMMGQMPQGSTFLHSGRIMRPWHIYAMADLKRNHPDIALGAIDNGSYTRLLSHFEKSGLRLDFLDVSVDGDEQSHNAQRGEKAYKMARQGIRKARRVANKVTSLMALSRLNSHSVASVVETLLEPGEVDELHFSPVLPYRSCNKEIGMGVEDVAHVVSQLVDVSATLLADQIHYRIYDVSGLEKLAQVVGVKTLRDAISTGMMDHGCLVFRVHGIEVSYYPLSLWPQEEVAIDADGTYRIAGYAKYTLDELKENTDAMGYTIGTLCEQSDLVTMYARCVRHYWRLYGIDHLRLEAQVFERIMA